MSDLQVGFCLSCCSVIPDHLVMKDKFIQSGMDGVCPFCGGRMRVIAEDSIESYRRRKESGETII